MVFSDKSIAHKNFTNLYLFIYFIQYFLFLSILNQNLESVQCLIAAQLHVHYNKR